MKAQAPFRTVMGGGSFPSRAVFKKTHIDTVIGVKAAGTRQKGFRHLARIGLAFLEAAAKGQSGHLFEIHLTPPVGRSLGRRPPCVHWPASIRRLPFGAARTILFS